MTTMNEQATKSLGTELPRKLISEIEIGNVSDGAPRFADYQYRMMSAETGDVAIGALEGFDRNFGAWRLVRAVIKRAMGDGT